MRKGFILSFLLFYIGIIVFTLIVIDNFFSKLIDLNKVPLKMYISIFGTFFLFVILILIYYIIDSIRDFTGKSVSLRYRLTLIFSFVFLVIFSTLPQNFIAFSFVENFIKYSYSPLNKLVLDKGYKFYLESYSRMESEIENLQNEVFTRSFFDLFLQNPLSYFHLISESNSSFSAIEVYVNDKNYFSLGDKKSFIQSDGLSLLSEANVVKETSSSGVFFRGLKNFVKNGKKYSLIISTTVPIEFESDIKNISKAYNYFNFLENYFFTGSNRKSVTLFLYQVIFLAPIFIFSIVLGFIVSKGISNPIEDFLKTIRIIADRNFSKRIISAKKSSFYNLETLLNEMIDKINLNSIELRKMEKIQTWKDMAERLAHEIKNPLTPIKLSTERIVRKYELKDENFDEIFKKSTSSILKEIDHLVNILNDFSYLSKDIKLNKKNISLKELIIGSCDIYSISESRLKKMDLEDVNINVDLVKMKQAIQNIIKNALDEIDDKENEVVKIYGYVLKEKDRSFACIKIENTGSYIDEKDMKVIFEPYFTNKVKGSGLGLSIVEKIVMEHSGKIYVNSNKEQLLTCFEIRIPI